MRYRPERFLRLASSFPRGHLTKLAELYLGCEFTDAIPPVLALGHESLPALADEHEKARHFAIAYLVLLLSRTKKRDVLVRESVALISHNRLHSILVRV